MGTPFAVLPGGWELRLYDQAIRRRPRPDAAGQGSAWQWIADAQQSNDANVQRLMNQPRRTVRDRPDQFDAPPRLVPRGDSVEWQILTEPGTGVTTGSGGRTFTFRRGEPNNTEGGD